MSIKTIGIIGGRGIMGQIFHQFFENRGFEVLVSGRDTELSHEELCQKSDLIIFSVPIHVTVEYIQNLSEYITEDKMLWDVTSIKSPAVDAMLATKAKEVVGGHPMFGAVSTIAGQVIVLTPGRGVFLQGFLKDIFVEAGAKVKELDAVKHDELMTVVQNLTHFSDITLAKAISKTGMDLQDFMSVQSPAYRLKLVMMGRILNQDPWLYGNMQLHNPMTPKTLDLFLETARELREIVGGKDLDGFIDYFNAGTDYLGDFAQVAHKESDLIIEKMFQKKVEFSAEDKKADVAILGPKNTYSSFACDEVFNETYDRKYCRTITEAFENVSKRLTQYALIPVENKLAGSVHESYDAMWNHEDLEVVGEMELEIKHVLASLKEVDLKEVETVYSHPHALTQCSKFLEQYRHMKRVAASSTADAVVQLNPRSVAIIPKKAAEKEHLHIQQEGIANSDENFTRFYLIKKSDQEMSNKLVQNSDQIIRTALAFELLKTKSGALLKVLQFFADEGINLLKLESKPVGDNGDTIFFIDTDGGMTQEQIQTLEKEVAILKVFGQVRKANPSQ